VKEKEKERERERERVCVYVSFFSQTSKLPELMSPMKADR